MDVNSNTTPSKHFKVEKTKVKRSQNVLQKTCAVIDKSNEQLLNNPQDNAAQIICLKNEVSKLKKENQDYLLRINNLEEILHCHNLKLECGPYFHECVVYKGTNTIVPCDCTTDRISSLPDEILLLILSYFQKSFLMTNCALVSKHWQKLCCNSFLWKTMNFSRQTVQSDVIGRVITYGVQNLILRRSVVKGSKLFQTLDNNERFSKLQHLNLNRTTISISALTQLLSVCSRLKTLELAFFEITDHICELISYNEDLYILNFNFVTGFTEKGISTIKTKCKKLVRVNIWGN